VCYELAQDFSVLYREFELKPTPQPAKARKRKGK
jgi:hypothetical protein